ncbi:MAG: SBBP repeat-containing protein, partial [Verrucomicrobia bacterium]|nr:SBBP repeat-containing protein [Verrucomicrobiota bacterium]
PDVKYYARTFGGTVYALSDGKIVYVLPRYEAGKKSGSAVITEILRDALQAAPAGAGKSPVAVSSFIGNRPEKWKSNLPAYDRLDFGEVYEGISLLLSARGNNVEKIFVLSPGADPRDIAFGFEGTSGIQIMPDGRLELQTALGKVYFTRPVAWQVDAQVHGSPFTVQGSREEFKDAAGPEAHALPSAIDSSQGRAAAAYSAVVKPLATKAGSLPRRPNSTPVEVAYALDEDGTVRFELGDYDQNKVLVIDPLLASTFIGGGGGDAVQAMVVDSQTNIYVAGYTASSDFPTNSSSYTNVNAGGYDAFVSKFDANLGSLSASTYLGGSSNDQATAIGIDASSRIWLAGYTESINFPHPSSPMYSTSRGGRDAFVAILTSNLNSLVQATYLGGSNTDYATAIAMDNSSFRQYIVGYTESANFPVTNFSGYATNYIGAGDAFAVVFSNNVTSLKGGTFLGGTNADEAAGVVITPGWGSTTLVYVVGATASEDFPITNVYQPSYGGSTDAFISCFGTLLTNLSASTFLGGAADDKAYAVALDASNRLYVAGSTRSSDFPQNPTGNVYYAGYANTYRGGQDVFVTCLTNSISNLYASTYIGGTNDDVAKCLVVDSSSATNLEYVYLAGYTSSSNFPTTRAAYDRSYNGGEDVFALRLDGPLTNMYASTYLGGVSNDQALAIALSPDTNLLFVAGITASSDLPSSDAAYQNVFGGGASDGFVAKFPAALAYGTVKWKQSLYYSGSRCSSPALTWDGSVVVGNITSLYAFTRSGAVRWQAAITASVAEYVDGCDGRGVPAVGTNNVIYVNT